MIRFANAVNAWGTPPFQDTLKQEIEQLDAEQLPLQQGLASSSYVIDKKPKAVIIAVSDQIDCIRVKAGIFFAGVIAGCSCADDPTPVDEQSEYCEVQFDINKTTGEASVFLLTDS